jgi:hypothetical protein
MSLNDVLTKLRYNHNNSNNHTKNKNIKTYEFRLQQLKQLKLFITDNELIIQEALKNDLGRSLFEGIGYDDNRILGIMMFVILMILDK